MDVAGPSGTTTGAVESIRLAGRLDGRCTSELREVLAAHVERHPDQDVGLDMSGVESVDLTALRLLAVVAVRLRRHGHHLVLQDCSPSMRRLLAHGVGRRLFVVQRAQPPGT